MKKVLSRIVETIVCSIMVAVMLTIPVYAAEETETAGATLGKEIIQFESEQYPQMRAVEGWKKDSKGWWYQYSDGSYPALSWRKIDGKWWYFNSSGYWVDNNTCESGSLKGIDVSFWQEEIDWQAVKEDGIEFAFVRAGYGKQKLDSQFRNNMEGANKVGIPVGVYYYSTARNEYDAVLDAQFVIANLKGYTVSYPVVLDLEDSSQENLSKTQIGKIARAFCNEVSAAGYTPMIYCNENWYQNFIDWNQIPDVEKWVARYNVTYNTSIPRGIWQCCSTGRVNGINGAVDIDFGYKDYTQLIVPRTEPIEGYKFTKGFWVKDSIGWWYRYYGGGYAANKWEMIGNKWYWFDAKGYMVTGWRYIGNVWYCFDTSGAMKTGWIASGGKWYYLDNSGAMRKGWVEADGKRYYLDNSGAMQRGWTYYDSKWYYLDGSGAMRTGWIKYNSKWYYLDGSGAMRTDWIKYNSKWYYLDGSGAMCTGWIKDKGKWYYLDEGGEMVTGVQIIEGEEYYFENDGSCRI